MNYEKTNKAKKAGATQKKKRKKPKKVSHNPSKEVSTDQKESVFHKNPGYYVPPNSR
jgi:hypothetical protein